jgi:hypothetical protein
MSLPDPSLLPSPLGLSPSGPPNAGKSTLIIHFSRENCHRLDSRRPRYHALGIRTRPDAQVIFVTRPTYEPNALGEIGGVPPPRASADAILSS